MSYPVWKRFMDVFGSILGIVIAIPFLPFIALAIKLDTPGPIFVKLDRISAGRVIRVYKFRSMVNNAEKQKKDLEPFNERNDGCFFKMKHDPRVTRTGRLLRRLRIDETPQFINVLKGEMALVGPRPHEPLEVAKYPAEYAHIASSVAGITGVSQVSGASSLKWLDELALDDFYVKNRSVGLDIWVIMRTINIFVSDPTGV